MSPFLVNRGENYGPACDYHLPWCVLDFADMRYLAKRILVGVCIALVMMLVHKVSRAGDFGWTGNGNNNYPSAFAACQSFANPGETVTIQFFGKYNASCFFNGVPRIDTNTSGGVCSPPNTLDLNGACVAPVSPVCTAGAETKFTTQWGHNTSSFTPPLPKGDGKCNVLGGADAPSADKCYSKPNSADPTIVYCDWVAKQSGTASGQSDAFSPPVGGPTLPAIPLFQGDQGGGCGGGMSNVGTDATGSPVCAATGTNPVAPDKTSTTSPTVTSTNPDGSTTTKSNTSSSNSDGSTTTNATTCTTATDGGKTCTTSQSTGNTPSGAAGKSDGSGVKADGTPDDKKNDLCTLHPELNVCKNSDVQGNGCSGASDATACTGDAIQCAILRQQRKEYCENSQVTPAKTLYDQMAGGSDPLASTLPSKANAQVVNGTNSIDQSGFLGGGSCYADYQFQYNGGSLAIPFSDVCPYLIPLRIAIMLSALVAAYFMLSGAILRE
ncbi:hypothetical protein [Collimonas sp.]|uniref:hypothetical protein n=1 Tax=Collimonas sp. TaxID=1963772 RepID=UPI002BECD717|nr:hypothetical protein [Collimonas sp.]HWW06327.1 hypothetical protein [Collimonas sp.]